jgi:hypothetical protein
MTGKEFIALANKLAKEAGAAECRSAVSRAYYGAFHVALALLARTGVVLPPAPEAHQKLRFCLLPSGEVSGAEAGEKLESLRRDRNRADYDLGQSRSEDTDFARRQVRVALEIAHCVESCGAEPAWSRFRTNIRAYATKVLRVELADESK